MRGFFFFLANEELKHHGIKGQRWGVRRYQNADGSYTKAGLARYKVQYGTEKAQNMFDNDYVLESKKKKRNV